MCKLKAHNRITSVWNVTPSSLIDRLQVFWKVSQAGKESGKIIGRGRIESSGVQKTILFTHSQEPQVSYEDT